MFFWGGMNFWKRFIYFQYISLIVAKMSECLFRLEIEKLDEGGFLATSPDVPGLVAEGRTIAETMEIAQDVAKKLIESYIEHGDPLPPKFRGKTPHTQEVKIAVSV